MKEFSIEEKAKAYDEALERAEKALEVLGTDKCEGARQIFSLFPELRESEDERVRKALLEMVHDTTGDELWVDYNVHKEDALAWLEKQGEQKPSTIDIDKMVDDYANNKERGNEEFGKPVPCMIRAYRQGLNDAIGKVVLKPAWSEEDEKMLVDAYVMIDWYEGNNWLTARHIKDWLKSLKERIGG